MNQSSGYKLHSKQLEWCFYYRRMIKPYTGAFKGMFFTVRTHSFLAILLPSFTTMVPVSYVYTLSQLPSPLKSISSSSP